MASMRPSLTVVWWLYIRCKSVDVLNFRGFHPEHMNVRVAIVLIWAFLLRIVAHGIVLCLHSRYWLEPGEVPVCVRLGCGSGLPVRMRREQGEVFHMSPISETYVRSVAGTNNYGRIKRKTDSFYNWPGLIRVVGMTSFIMTVFI